MKRVAHLTFDMSIGGAERVIENLVRGTDRSRFDVSVLCLSWPVGEFGVQLQQQGFHVTAFGRRPGFDLKLVRDLRRHLVRERVDILHCHQYTPFAYGVLSSVLTRTAVIFTEHGRFYPDRKRWKRVAVNPLLCRIAAHLTAISSATKRALVQYENFPGSRIRVVYNGVDVPQHRPVKDASLLNELGMPPGARVLGTLARLDPIKNHVMMVKAFHATLQRHPDAYLLIVGDGPERSRIETFAEGLNLRNRVVLPGFRQDGQALYALLDVFLLSSHSEGTAMTLLEAMGFGLPSVITDVGGNPEIIEHGVSGFLVARDDHSAMAERICEILSDPRKAQEMGAAARKAFETRFTTRAMVQAYESLYSSLG